jgi:hypothetical protein
MSARRAGQGRPRPAIAAELGRVRVHRSTGQTPHQRCAVRIDARQRRPSYSCCRCACKPNSVAPRHDSNAASSPDAPQHELLQPGARTRI